MLMNDDNVYMPEKDFERLKKYSLSEHDLLISVVGTIGNVAMVQKTDLPAIFSCKSTALTAIKINPAYLLIYLSTSYIQKLLYMKTRGAVQTGLNLTDLENIPIMTFNTNFQDMVAAYYYESYQKAELSEQLYKQAENLLLSELSLEGYVPTQENISVKSLSSSFFTSGRLDAEYYHPKYDEIEKRIKAKGFILLDDICSLINYGTVPTSPYTQDGTGVAYIKGLNLKQTQILGKLDKIVNTELLPDKYYTQKGDIIISQMGTVGDVGVVDEKHENMLFASFTIRARLKKGTPFLPLFIGLYIQLVAKKWYLHRNIAQASVRQNTDLPTIKNMYIPILSADIQQQLADKIQESFFLKEQAENLLKNAVKAVEIAIEQDEETATNWLNEHGKNLK